MTNNTLRVQGTLRAVFNSTNGHKWWKVQTGPKQVEEISLCVPNEIQPPDMGAWVYAEGPFSLNRYASQSDQGRTYVKWSLQIKAPTYLAVLPAPSGFARKQSAKLQNLIGEGERTFYRVPSHAKPNRIRAYAMGRVATLAAQYTSAVIHSSEGDFTVHGLLMDNGSEVKLYFKRDAVSEDNMPLHGDPIVVEGSLRLAVQMWGKTATPQVALGGVTTWTLASA